MEVPIAAMETKVAQKKKVTEVTPKETEDATDGLLTIPPALAREARLLDAATIAVLRVPLDIVRHNAVIGAKAVLDVRDQIKALLKKADFSEVERLVSLVDATSGAARGAKTTELQRPRSRPISSNSFRFVS